MTDQTPIERAAQDIARLLHNPGWLPAYRHYAHEAFLSIDTDQLWETIQYAQQNGDDPALAVKNWLTGKDTQ